MTMGMGMGMGMGMSTDMGMGTITGRWTRATGAMWWRWS